MEIFHKSQKNFQWNKITSNIFLWCGKSKLIEDNGCETLRSSLLYVLVLLFDPDCAQNNSSLLLIITGHLTNRHVLIMKLMHSQWARNKRLCTVVDLRTLVLKYLFASLMFARLHNHSPLLSMGRYFCWKTKYRLTVPVWILWTGEMHIVH